MISPFAGGDGSVQSASCLGLASGEDGQLGHRSEVGKLAKLPSERPHPRPIGTGLPWPAADVTERSTEGLFAKSVLAAVGDQVD